MKNNKALKILFVANSVFVFAQVLLGPFFAVYVQNIGGGIMTISWAMAVNLLATTLFLVFVAKFGDKIKRKEEMLAMSYLVRVVGYLGYIWVGNSFWLMMLMIWLGLGEALGVPSFNVIFAKHLDRKNEVSEYADWSVISNLIMALATIVGGVFISYFGFNALFVLMSVMSMVSFVLIKMTPNKVFEC